MDIRFDKLEILRIYNENTNLRIYKNANNKARLFIFIIPITVAILSFCLLFYGILRDNNIVYLISLLLIFLTFYYYNKSYDDYIEGKYKLKKGKNKDLYYHIFVKNLKFNGIKSQKNIQYYIELLELDNNATNYYKTGFLEYASLIYIPGLMIYFNNEFEKSETMAYLSIGLFFVPIFIFLFKILFINKKHIKYDTILQYLKRRNIELTYK